MATAKWPASPVGNAAFAAERHGWSAATRRGRMRRYISCNDSLGRRRVERQGSIVRRRPESYRRLVPSLVASKFSKIVLWGNSRLSPRRAKPIETCCHWPEFRLVESKLSKIVLGGTAASHTCSGVGGGHFLIKKSGTDITATLWDRTVIWVFVLAVP
jgi:hypothetical protein